MLLYGKGDDSVKYLCGNCGAKVNADAHFCPKCGAELGEAERDGYGRRRESGFLSKLLTLIVVFGLCYAGYYFYQDYQNTNYHNALAEAYNVMASVTDECGEVGNQLYKVWYNWINEIKDEETDQFTQRDGKKGRWYDHINDVMDNLYADNDFSKRIEKANKETKQLQNLMTKINNPPQKYDEAYQQFRKTYNIYIDFYNQAIDPEGTYDENYEKYKGLRDDLYKQMNILYTLID